MVHEFGAGIADRTEADVRRGYLLTICRSSLEQMGAAFALDTNDSDGAYPSCEDDKAKIIRRPPAPETPDLTPKADRHSKSAA